MESSRFRPHSSLSDAVEFGLYTASAILVIVHYLVPIASGQETFAWWTTPLLAAPLLLALILRYARRGMEVDDRALRLRDRSWRDSRLQSPQER